MGKPPSNSGEGKARKLIDKMLKEAGWELLPEGSSVPQSGNFAIDEADMKVVITTLDVVETRERLLAAENLIVGDKYEFIKDVYMQSRNDLVLDGEVEDEFIMDFELELFEEDLPENQ